jgi:hypothetical protein
LTIPSTSISYPVAPVTAFQVTVIEVFVAVIAGLEGIAGAVYLDTAVLHALKLLELFLARTRYL